MSIVSEQELSVIRGKVLGGVASKSELIKVFEFIDVLEELLDSGKLVRGKSTAGWRVTIGWEG